MKTIINPKTTERTEGMAHIPSKKSPYNSLEATAYTIGVSSPLVSTVEVNMSIIWVVIVFLLLL